ncbi:MAG: hypothetical protein U0800_27870, partial [Isosphaeraceae bacterium]
MPDFEHDLNDDLKAIEGRLRGWAPSSPRIERDRLMFEAGRAASARKSTRFSWPMATAATALIALGALGGWAQEHSKRRAVELAWAQGRRALPPSPPIDAPVLIAIREPSPIEPTSYMALSRRLSEAGELDEPSTADIPAGSRSRP